MAELPEERVQRRAVSSIHVPQGFDVALTGLGYAVDRQGNNSYLYQTAHRGEWTPVLTAVGGGLNLGSTGVAVGEYLYFAGRCWFDFTVQFSGAGIAAGTGIYELTVPMEPRFLASGGTPVGMVHLRDSGLNSKWWTVDLESGINRLRFVDPDGAFVDENSPWVWGSGDSIRSMSCMMKVADV